VTRVGLSKIISNFKLIVEDCFTCLDIVVASILSWMGYRYELMFINSWGFSFKPAPSGLISDGLSDCAGGIWHPLEVYQGIKLITKNPEVQDALCFIREELRNNRPVILNTDTYWCPWHEFYQRIRRPHCLIILGIDDESNILYCMDKFTQQAKEGPSEMSFKDFSSGYQSIMTISLGKPICEIDGRKIIREAVLCTKGQTNYDLFYALKKGDFCKKAFLAFKLRQNKYSKPNCIREMMVFAQKISESSLENEKRLDLPLERNPLLMKLMLIANGRKKFGYLMKYLAEEYKIESLTYFSNIMFIIASLWQDVLSHLYKYLKTTDIKEKSHFYRGVRTMALFEEMFLNMLIKHY